MKKMPEKCPKSRLKPRKTLPNTKNDINPKNPGSKGIEESKDLSLKFVNQTSKEPLSLRKDVVYKTLIRSLKRYLTEK